MLPEQLNSSLLVLIVSCSFQPVGPVVSKIKVFLATKCLISVIQYTSDLLLEKESRTCVISECWTTSNRCFCEGQVQGSTMTGQATAVPRAEGKRRSGEAPCRGQATAHGCRQARRTVTPAVPSRSITLGRRGGEGYQSGAAPGCVL